MSSSSSVASSSRTSKSFCSKTTWQVEQASVPSQAPNPSRSMSLLIATSSRLSPSLAWGRVIRDRMIRYVVFPYRVTG